MIFFVILGLTICALIADIVLSVMLSNPSDNAKSAIELCSTIAKLGVGAIFGLVGGKLPSAV